MAVKQGLFEAIEEKRGQQLATLERQGRYVKNVNYLSQFTWVALNITAQELGGVWVTGRGWRFGSVAKATAFVEAHGWTAEKAAAKRQEKAAAKRQAILDRVPHQTARLVRNRRYVKPVHYLHRNAWNRLDAAAHQMGGEWKPGKGWYFPLAQQAENFRAEYNWTSRG